MSSTRVHPAVLFTVFAPLACANPPVSTMPQNPAGVVPSETAPPQNRPLAPATDPERTVTATITLTDLDVPQPLTRYLLTDAVAVPGLPLTVNREFDFASAMMLDMGAAIAAAKRQRENKALAAELLSARLPDPAPAFLEGTEACERDVYTVNLEALLFGGDIATLQTVARIELSAAAGHEPPVFLIHISRGRAVTGEDSWTAQGGAALAEQWSASVHTLGRLLCELPRLATPNADAASERCAIGKREAFEGVRVGEIDSVAVLAEPLRKKAQDDGATGTRAEVAKVYAVCEEPGEASARAASSEGD